MKLSISRLVSLLCCLPLMLSAGEGYRFRYIDLPESMRDATISGAMIDGAGMLWFNTNSGLHRYDGSQLLTLNQLSTPAIASNAITKLFADTKNNIWIGTRTGLIRLDLRSWSAESMQLPDNNTSFITEICESKKDGNIYVGTNEGRFMRLEGNQLKLLADFGKEFPAGPTQAAVNFLCETQPGVFWLLSNNRLIRVDWQGKVFNPPLQQKVSMPIHFFSPDKALIKISGKDMAEYDVNTGAILPLPGPFSDSLTNRKRMLLFPLPDGEVGLFINTRGIFSYNPLTRTVKESLRGVDVDFSHLRASSIQMSGNKAFITFPKSIAELQVLQTPFTNLLVTPASNAQANSVRSILRHPNGLLYTGTYSNGFISLNEHTGEMKPLGSQFVYASLLWDNDRLLLATEGHGLLWYHIKANRFEPVKGDTMHTPPADQLRDLFFNSLARESDSLVWVGAYHGALLLNPYTGATWYLREGKGWEGLRNAKVYHILKSGVNRYFATTDGLYVYNVATKQLAKQGGEALYMTLEVGQERWLATNGKGILIMDANGRLKTTLSTQNGLAGNAVYYMLRKGDRVVAGTDQGLSIIRLPGLQVRNFTRMQNLPSNEFNHSAVWVNGDRFYLGTINGLTMFNIADLARLNEGTGTVPLHFSSISMVSGNGVQHNYTLPYNNNGRLEIPAGVRYFSLRFGGVDAAVPQVYYYRTRNNGPWLELGQQRQMSFAGMAPGAYDVQLAAKLNGGVAYTTLLTLPLRVMPAWYETVWFRICCVLLLICCVWLLFRYRMQQLLREQRLRTKIAGDLHDEVGSSLTRIYFQADHLSMRHGEKAALQKIADSSKHALSTMSDMVWSIDARFDTAEDLVERIRDYLSNLQNDLDIKCTFELQGEYAGRPLSQAVRQNFFLIFKEATNNAARYSSEPFMKVQLVFDKSLYMRVCNRFCGENGKMKQYQGGRGMEQMQARAGRMKGSLTIVKDAGEFVVELQIPGQSPQQGI